MTAFKIFNLMYLILEELNETNKNETVETFLSDANPYIWEGENSGDPSIFFEFKKEFEEKGNYEDYGYEFIINYLSGLDYYVGLGDCIKSLSKEEYIDSCNYIINEQPRILKKL